MKTLKQTIIAFGALILLTIGLFALTGAMSNQAKAAPPQRGGGVVVLVARPETNINLDNLFVIFSSSSQGAPTVPRYANLAQVLDDLLAGGFHIQHTENTSIGMHYTLVR